MSSKPQGLSTRVTGTAKRSRSRRFGVRSLTRRSYPSALGSVKRPRVRAQVLLRQTQLLRRVDGQPDPLVAEGAQAPERGELGERGRLVIAPLRQGRERLLAERVDAAADPILEEPRF